MSSVAVASTAAATQGVVAPKPPSRWPLFAAPVVGLIYYLAALNAFSTAIRDVVANASDLDQMAQVIGLRWGTHWIYHTFAEAISIAFGTFVAGGLARERATIGGLIGGFGISLCWMAPVVAKILVSLYAPDAEFVDEPWYEYVIGTMALIAAPIAGYRLGDMSWEFSTQQPAGFAGIPRAHFLWLWFPAYWYAAAMIGPFLNYYAYFGETYLLKRLLFTVVYFVPLLAFAVPLFVGLGLLAGQIPNRGRGPSAGRQLLGVLVLLIGWCIAAGVDYGIIKIVNWL